MREPFAESYSPPSQFNLLWYHPGGGDWIGEEGLLVADLDADGDDEILAATMSVYGVNTTWYIYDGGSGEYQQVFAAPPRDVPVTALAVADVDGDAASEILVGRGGTVLVYDGSSHELEHEIITPLEFEMQALGGADVDLDGQAEIACIDEARLVILDPSTGVIEHEIFALGFTHDLQIGQVDADPALEIVVTTNALGAGYVIDGATGSVEWEHPGTFGERVRLADIDGDSREEIVAGFALARAIEVWDADTQTLLYHLPTEKVLGLGVANVDDDEKLEIVYGDQLLEVHVLRASDGTEKWSVFADDEMTNLSIGNTDDDAAIEIVWGDHPGGSGPHRLHAVDAATQSLEWHSHAYSLWYSSVEVANLEGNGQEKILATIGDFDGFSSPAILVFDEATKHLETVVWDPSRFSFNGSNRLRAIELDADPQVEILYTPENNFGESTLFSLDGITFDTQWQTSLSYEHRYAAVDAGDVDGDGELEVVAPAAAIQTQADPFLDVFDGETGALEWRSPSLGVGLQQLTLLRLAEVDGDPNPEIVVAADRGALYILSADDQTVDLATPDLEIQALDTADLDGDSVAEVVVGDRDGLLAVIDPATGGTTVLADFGRSITSLRLHDMTGDGEIDAVMGVGLDLILYDLAAAQTLASWSPGASGRQDGIGIVDLDGDGIPEIFSRDLGLFVFRWGLPDSIFSDGFESGDTSAWSSTTP